MLSFRPLCRVRMLALACALLSGTLLASAEVFAAPVDAKRIGAAADNRADWLTHGRTYDEQRFSPLTKINHDNVSDLKLAWYFDLDTRRGQEATPLVVDGTMYVTSAWSKVFALDARTGREKWRFDPQVAGDKAIDACCDVVNRGVAAWGGKRLRRHARRPPDRARREDRQAGVDGADDRPEASATRSPARRASSRARSSSATAAARWACAVTSPRTTPRPARCSGASIPCPATRRTASRTRDGDGREDVDRRVVEVRRRRHRVGFDRLRSRSSTCSIIGVGNGSPVESHAFARTARATTCSCRRSSRCKPDTGEYVWHFQTYAGGVVGLHGHAAHHARGPDDRRPEAQGR